MTADRAYRFCNYITVIVRENKLRGTWREEIACETANSHVKKHQNNMHFSVLFDRDLATTDRFNTL